MEEIRETALAYYNNLPEEQRRNAYMLFRAMDLNGDSVVTVDEYLTTFSELGFPQALSNRRFFAELDQNGDGFLEFEEFLSVYYLLKSGRLVFCDGCRVFLKGLYFTCVHCYLHNPYNTFDLCCVCYRYSNYGHQHVEFLDNFSLLRCMRPSVQPQPPPQPRPIPYQLQPSPFHNYNNNIAANRGGNSRMDNVRRAFGVLNAGLGIAQLPAAAGFSCNIM